MPLAPAAIAIDNGTVLMLIALIAVPFAAIAFSRAGEAYRSIGKGDLAIDQDLTEPRHLRSPEQAVDPAIRAAEVRQMLEAKADRLRRGGAAPIDVEAEAARLLAPPEAPSSARAGRDAELRDEVRSLVIARNERRMRAGVEPVDVEAETERQLADFIGLGE
jgi:hypothetical protein